MKWICGPDGVFGCFYTECTVVCFKLLAEPRAKQAVVIGVMEIAYLNGVLIMFYFPVHRCVYLLLTKPSPTRTCTFFVLTFMRLRKLGSWEFVFTDVA